MFASRHHLLYLFHLVPSLIWLITVRIQTDQPSLKQIKTHLGPWVDDSIIPHHSCVDTGKRGQTSWMEGLCGFLKYFQWHLRSSKDHRKKLVLSPGPTLGTWCRTVEDNTYSCEHILHWYHGGGNKETGGHLEQHLTAWFTYTQNKETWVKSCISLRTLLPPNNLRMTWTLELTTATKQIACSFLMGCPNPR